MNWDEPNGWWADFLSRKPVPEDWDEADRQLRCLVRWVDAGRQLKAMDREDIVQDMFLKLQTPSTWDRVANAQHPARYLATALRNQIADLLNERGQQYRAGRRWAEERGEKDKPATRPDAICVQKEREARGRFVLNDVLSHEDRQILNWFYKDRLRIAAIARRLDLKVNTVAQRLLRARIRFRDHTNVE